MYRNSDSLTGLTAKIILVGRCQGNERIERRAGRETRSEEEKKKDRRRPPRGWWRRAGGRGFLLGPIKKPVSSSVSKSLLWHSRQLRKHLKAPEKPDNTSLVECRVPLGGRRRDFAPLSARYPPFSVCCNIGSILCIKHRVPSSRRLRVRSRRDMFRVKEIPLARFLASVVNRSPSIISSYLAKRLPSPSAARNRICRFAFASREMIMKLDVVVENL